MKKFYSKTLVFLFSAMLIFTLFNTNIAYGDDRDITIDDFIINSEIIKNGDMQNVEDITFDFSGEYNGVTRQLLTVDNSTFDKISVAELKDGNSISYKLVKNASKGDTGVYTIEKTSPQNYTLWIYSPAEDTSKTFRISYTITNVITKYNDTAELYWKYIGTDNKTPIANLDVTVTLPEGGTKEELKIWGHGPLNGFSKIIDYKTLELGVSKLPSKTYVEARILFPNKLVPTSTNRLDEDALGRVLKEEKAWADEANRLREVARKKILFGQISALVLLILSIILSLFVYLKYGKEFKPEFTGVYYRELPKDYTPAVMSALMSWGNISPRDISATLMDLIRKKYLKLDVETDKFNIIKIKEPDSKLLSHEVFFMDWMIRIIGDGYKVALDDIKSYSKSKTNAKDFLDDYSQWTSAVNKDAEKFNFFDTNNNTGRIIGIISGLLIIILSIFTIIFTRTAVPVISIISGAFLIIVSASSRRRTQNGSTEYKMWNAFKKFLKDFSNMKEVPVTSLVLWEHYLVYAISLNVAKRVIKQLKVVIPDYEYSNNNLTYLYMFHSIHHYNSLETFETLSHDFEDITKSVVQLAQTSNSSFSGGGGGFSGGGGAGGGGGGAGGF